MDIDVFAEIDIEDSFEGDVVMAIDQLGKVLRNSQFAVISEMHGEYYLAERVDEEDA